MIDLNSTLFFKGKFQINAGKAGADLLWRLVLEIRNWMVPKWRRNGETIPDRTARWSMWKNGGTLSSENGMVHFKSVLHNRADGMQFWACKIVESWPSRNGHAPREWTTEIGFQQETPERATVSIVIYYSDRPGFIGPCEEPPAPSVPRIISLLREDEALTCTVEGYPIQSAAVRLRPGDFPEFWRVVCDETREVPVIYVSPRRSEEVPERCENLVDPERLVKVLGPNALVYYADDLDFSREMTQLCRPGELGCYSGALRVYAPHPRTDDPGDSYRHRLLGARSLLEMGEKVYDILRRALAQDVHFYEKMFRVEDCKELNDRAAAEKRREEYRVALENELLDAAVEKEKLLQKKLEEIDEERFAWEVKEDDLYAQIKDLKKELRASKAAQETYRAAAAVSNSRKNALDRVRRIDKYPESPQEVVRYFLTHFEDRLAFTEKGLASLRDCTTSPSVLWDALFQMVTTLFDLYEDENVVLVDQAFNRLSSLNLARGEGTMTRKDAGLMRQYVDTYQGKEIDIEAHLKTSENRESSSRFLRIYFHYDPDAHKLIVGSCGRHLDNYTTQKIR